MKRKVILWIGVLSLFLATGCFGKKNDDLLEKFKKQVSKSDNYYLSGDLEITNHEEVYSYVVEVAYKKEDQFRVELKNKTNDHEQIILKNKEGVFVLTPSLNKSFKFQSDWPYNSSQSYLLQTLITDIQKIYIDKDGNVTKVEVLDKNGMAQIKMMFSDIDYDTKFDENYFDLNSNMQASKTDKLEQTQKSINDVVYPMFLPTDTHLASENKVSKTDGERVILTFTGEKPFTFVQENVGITKEYETITTFGEPQMLLDTIGIVEEQTVSWISEGVEYYLTSEVMSKDELIEVASSMATVPIEK